MEHKNSAGQLPAEKVPFLIFALVWIAFSYLIVFVLSPDTVGWVAKEDGIIEYIGAACFLAASVLFFVLYKQSRASGSIPFIPMSGNVFYLLLGLAFLFVCMEEISWGQRIFGFETPESIRGANSQSEFNIHNLQVFHGETESGERKSFFALLLNMDRMFSMFWFSYCFLLPIIYKVSSPARKLLDTMLMPIVPLFLGSIFVLNYALTKGLEAIVDAQLHHSIVEIKESIIAMLFLLLAIWFLRNGRTTSA